MKTPVVLLLLLAGCPRSKGTEEQKLPVPAATDAAPAAARAPKPYTPTRVLVEARAVVGVLPVAPPGATWPDRIYTADEIDDLIEDDLPKLGRFAMIPHPDGHGLGPPAADGSVEHEGIGPLGIKAERIIGFVDPPPILKGEMPLGGSVRLSGQGSIIVKMTPAGGSSPTPTGPLEEHVLIELVDVRDFDGTDWIYARLLGYRLVDPGKREVIYDSLAAVP
jgi:hypothetical protein